MEDKEKLYQSHLGTIQRTPGGYKYPGDFKAAGFPADEWPRLVKDSGLDEVEFYGEPGFPEKPIDPTKYNGKKILGVGKFNKATNIFCGRDSLVYQHETTGKMEDSYFIKTTYSVYLVNIGAGNKPKFVFCDPSQKVESGESSLYLKPLSEEKVGEIVEDLIKSGGLVDFVEKKARIKIYKKDCSIDDYAEALIKTHSKNPLFFMQTLPLPIEVLNEIPDFYKFAMDALSQGITVDENLVDMYVSKIPEHNASKIKPKTAMPFSDNGVIITNAGVGKTTLANMINYAGFYYGVGIWSPRCKSGGSYGMYKLG